MDFALNKLDKFVDNLKTIDEKMKDLKKKQEELYALKVDMESRRNTELHPRKKLKREVELWFTNVEKINDKILDLEQKIGESNAASRGWGSLTGNVLKTKQEVEELISQQGNFHDGLLVDNPAGWIGQVLSTTTLFGEAAKICMEKIWAYLMDGDVRKIGVWGLGGIGKTTIMKLVHNQLLKETDKYDIVRWITVSKEISIIKLQDRIARAMGETLSEDEDKTIRAGMIHEMLARKGKFVLILDDLWDQLSLEEVGIPDPSNGSKLLVTTRSLDVCRYLNCREVKVSTLSKPDAWSLFLEKVGQEVLNHPDLLPTVKSVAKECAGVPLAIVTIASSMRGVCDIHEWSNALHELSRHIPSVNGMEEKIFQQLQFSYDRLKGEKLKNCFLYCALFPEDSEIDPATLIELWVAEGLVEEMDSLKMETDRGHAILNKLKNNCLLEAAGEEHTIRNNVKVKLHDVVRDMALRITSVRPRFLVRAGMQLKEIFDLQDWNKDVEKVSLIENWGLQIPPQMTPPKCPNLTTLLLSKCSIESIPDGFFEQMHGLKILDLSYNYGIKSLPNTISDLKNLTTLLLRECYELENVPSLLKLEALKKLDLGFTNIKDIPDGMKKLINLKYLNLGGTWITKMDDGILAKFTFLRHLKLINFVEQGGISVRGAEIGGLRKLEIFEGRFDDLNEWNRYALAPKSRPRKYRIFVGPADASIYWEWDKWISIDGGGIYFTDGMKIPYDVQSLNVLHMIAGLCEKEALFSGFIIPMPHNIFSSLSRINIWECKNIKKLFSSIWVLHNLQNLEYLSVRHCDEMEEIIAPDSEITSTTTASSKFTTALPKLISFEVRDLPELKSICGANGAMVCDSIQEIEIKNCPKLKRIPMNLPLQDGGQPSPPPSLRIISVSSEQWWELVEWDHPITKSLLQPYVSYNPGYYPRKYEPRLLVP